jgi:DNA-binding protein YbaB
VSEPAFGIDAARTREEIEKWAAEAEAKAARYQRMQHQVAAVRSTASSRDGLVRVTVDSGGAPTDLQISDQARRLSGAAVAASVMSTIQRAQAGIGDQVAAVVTDATGEDTATADAIVSAYRQRFPSSDARGGGRPPGDRAATHGPFTG